MAYMQNPAASSSPVVVATPFDRPCASIYVGVGGSVVVEGLDGANSTWVVENGGMITQRCKQVVSVSGGAASMLALFN